MPRRPQHGAEAVKTRMTIVVGGIAVCLAAFTSRLSNDSIFGIGGETLGTYAGGVANFHAFADAAPATGTPAGMTPAPSNKQA